MNKFFSFFSTDIHWKLIALFLAFLLWIVGSNVNNPHENGSINARLNVANFELLANEGIVLLNEDALDTGVNVGVRGARDYLSALLGADAHVQEAHVIPSIDFRAIDFDAVRISDVPVTVRLDITANLYEGLEPRSIRPRYVDLELDVLMRHSFQIEVEILNEVAPNFEIRPIRLANSWVTVTGARSVVSEIDSVWVSIDVVGLHTESEESVSLVVLDHAGRDITDMVELSVRETTATIPVWPIDALEFDVEPTGEVAAGFAVAEIEFYPQTINIIAPEERLIQLTPLLMGIDVETANATINRSISVLEYLPDGVYLAQDQSSYVDVTVVIEPIENRIFFVPRDNVRSRMMAPLYEVLTDVTNIRVVISGPRSLLSDLTSADIGLELDLRNLPIGIHNVALSVELPAGMSLAQVPPRLQVQIHESVTDEPNDYDHYYVDNPDPVTPIMPPDYPSDTNGNENDIMDEAYPEYEVP